MALTFDPTTALIVVDLQKGIAGYQFIHPFSEIVDRTRDLLEAFRRHRLPVVLVNVDARPPGRTEQGSRASLPTTPGWTDLLPELDQQPDDIVVTKRSWGAFATTDLESRLKALGVTQVVVTGVVTSVGVEATARQAYEQGFNVTLALDAMTDMSAEAHDHSIKAVFPRLGESGTSRDIVDRLASRTGKP